MVMHNTACPQRRASVLFGWFWFIDAQDVIGNTGVNASGMACHLHLEATNEPN